MAGGDPHALPVTTDALVGRDTELTALVRLLAEPDSRLLTLTGPPGVGKTRLAIAAAVVAAPRFPAGARFVDLSEIRDPELVPAAVLGAVGCCDIGAPTAADQMVGARTGKNELLVIDNFEHVLDAGPPVAATLTRFPGLRLLMTSRERLHLRAEREIPVRPLGLARTGDDRGWPTVAPAVQMLVERVRRLEPGFEVTPANHVALVEICARLDGLPLALELAAAQLKLFAPGELTFRLGHRTSILVDPVRDAPQRHRTLRAALAWSHDLLTPAERAAFRRLSVFAGGATLEGAEEVCDLADPVGTIASLVDKSLLHRRIRPDGVAEFVMLHTLREYARELLVEHGEEEVANARHARYFANLAVVVGTAIGEADEGTRVESVRFEQANLCKALVYATAAADAGQSLPLASALGWYADRQDRRADGAGPLDRAQAAVDSRQRPPPGGSQTHALLIAAVLALVRGDLDDAEALLRRVLVVEEDRPHTAIATAFQGHLARARGQPDQAVGHHARAAEMFTTLGNLSGAAWSRFDLGLLAHHRGDADVAASHLRESLTRFRTIGDARAVARVSWALTALEDLSPAGCVRREPLAHVRRLGPPETPRKPPPVPADDGGRDHAGRPVATLTTRELQVAHLVADGSTNRQIARSLGIAEKTTEAHLRNIIRKLGARNRAEVAARVSAPKGWAPCPGCRSAGPAARSTAASSWSPASSPCSVPRA
ncbi:MAG: tetratricopeptide repeat protein [Pseudonocardia sp.]|nr:tetratricopeptide repeat protein [Pseudonocardia sp.]